MASKTDLERLSLRLPAGLKRRVDRMAQRRSLSVAAVVRFAIEDYLRREDDRLFVAELQQSYEAVRAEDLDMVEAWDPRFR